MLRSRRTPPWSTQSPGYLGCCSLPERCRLSREPWCCRCCFLYVNVLVTPWLILAGSVRNLSPDDSRYKGGGLATPLEVRPTRSFGGPDTPESAEKRNKGTRNINNTTFRSLFPGLPVPVNCPFIQSIIAGVRLHEYTASGVNQRKSAQNQSVLGTGKKSTSK